jgi:hypothetical protein
MLASVRDLLGQPTHGDEAGDHDDHAGADVIGRMMPAAADATSSAANVGAGKERRQREAIQAFARRAGYDLMGSSTTRL